MKTSLTIMLMAAFIFASIANVSAITPAADNAANKKAVENNLIEELNTTSTTSLHSRVSTIYSLGEIKSSKALIPLLKILHDEKKVELRISAALSLIKIGDARGVYAVKQAAKFDDSPRVRRLCAIFYNAYVNGKV